MKETIYTIPLSEAFEQTEMCPFCFLQKKLEDEGVEYALGPAMMEPDHRILSNEKGYCNRHLDMMFTQQNKLPLALVLDTRLEYIYEHIARIEKQRHKKHIFLYHKKSETNDIPSVTNSCIICDKIEHTMSRYYDVMMLMWKKDSDFRTKFDEASGFCMPHFEKLYSLCKNDDLTDALIAKEKKTLDILRQDIQRFTLKFDYRSRDMELGAAKDAPLRTTEKLVGYIKNRD